MAGSKKQENSRPKLVGVNHIALEVGDIEEALAFYGRIFDFSLRSKSKGQAFIDMGDQFIALMETKDRHEDDGRHFGVVVDDRSAVRGLSRRPAGGFCRGRSSISSIPGAIGSRWWTMPISSSPRRPMCCVAWASTSARTRARCAS